MKVSYNWLKDYVSFSITPEELAQRLTMAGLEVETIQNIGNGIEGVVVGEVLSVEKHPNADKLSFCKVNVGNEHLEIVCGAPNVATGQKVPVAPVGTELPGGIKIKKSKIREIFSHGMICSEKELGLSEFSAGIMVLPDSVNVGGKFIDEMEIRDSILEINVTPNRPDCLNMIGIAREISCLLRLPLNLPENCFIEEIKDTIGFLKIENNASDLCPRYTARYISDIKVAPSPLWLQRRLQSVGIRSINNVVDITNYVLMEWGHPLHAFDSRFIEGNIINIRKAADKEIFETLDGVKRTLTNDMLVIADQNKPIALAGIMGGSNSEVKNDTTNIILESAYFDPCSIRRTSKKLDISSESSYRFERGTDINGLISASERAIVLIQKLAGGKVARGIIDIYPQKFNKKTITLRPERLNSVLGVSLPVTEIENILVRLCFIPAKKEIQNEIEFIVPSFRPDITREIDLIEEVARIYGYERIKSKAPMVQLALTSSSKENLLTNKIKNTLAACGMNEIISYSFICEEQFNKICLPHNDKKRNAIKIKNPLALEQSLMRTLLLPSLLEAVKNNFQRSNYDLRIFEVGKVYIPEEGYELPYEEQYIGIALTGNVILDMDISKHKLDILDLKGIVENLTEVLGLQNCKIEKTSNPTYHTHKCFQLKSSEIILGIGGELHPDVIENYKFEQPIFAIELSIDKIAASLSAKENKKFNPISIYPAMSRDISLLVKKEITHEKIFSNIKNIDKNLIEEIKLFDLYEGKSLPSGFKSMGYRITFRSKERTLVDEEVEKIIQKILYNLSKKLNIELRQ